MSEAVFNTLLAQIDMLSYSERLSLLDKISSSLRSTVKPVENKTASFDAAFGLWADREISTSEIRRKAWERSQ